jgi:hypothetical protein
MFGKRLPALTLGGAVGLFGLSGAASAQVVGGCGPDGCAATNRGSYGPALFSPNPKTHLKPLNGCEPYCVGRSSYPLSDLKYIRQFCGPTLLPGSCYGHFQTKWRKWEDHCPGGDCASAAADPYAVPGGVMLSPMPTATPVQSMPAVPATPIPEIPRAAPTVTPNTVDPVAPPKVPAIPKTISLTQPADLPTPPVPTPPVPVPSLPAAPTAVNPAAQSGVVPAVEPQRVIVPPLSGDPRGR